MTFTYYTNKEGLEAFFKPWQVIVIKYLEKNPEWANTRQITDHVIETKIISRASIIQFLTAMKKTEILEYSEKTGKGGHQGLYRLKYKEKALRETLTKHIIETLLKNFPQETKRAIKKIQI